MLPSLALSASSLDQFRRSIYRPRLCLLLLLVLLSPYNTSQLAAPAAVSTVSVSQPAQHGWSISIIDGLVVAAPPPASQLLSTVSSTASTKLKADSAHFDRSAKGAARPSSAPSSPKRTEADEAASSPSPASPGQPAPGSLFRFPKLSWGLIVDEHVLPALLTLHVLWLIRLAGMAVEDGVVKNTLLGARSRFHSVTLPIVYLSVLFCLAILTGHPRTGEVIRSWCRIWRQKLGFQSLPSDLDSHVQRQAWSFRSDGLLPASLFVGLETASTLVHLLSILPKVDAAVISRVVPMQLKLPSPSHLPPLVEMLPLPRSLKVVLTEPGLATPAPRYASRRRPMMPSMRPAPTAGATIEHVGTQETNMQQQQASPLRADENVPSARSFARGPAGMVAQQVFRRVGAPENEVLRSTSVVRPIAPLTLPENENLAHDSMPSVSRRRRAPRLRGQSVLVSTKWVSETATALFDKMIGAVIYAVITLRLPTLTPTSLPPVLSLLSLRSELASLTQIWTRARSSVECLEFVRRRWGVQLEQGQDPYTSVPRPRASAAAGDYQWKSYDDVYCAICFELTRCSGGVGCDDGGDGERRKRRFEFCRLDCGHELHDVCLVSWLTAQAFCPTCHVVLSFSPRAAAASRRSTA